MAFARMFRNRCGSQRLRCAQTLLVLLCIFSLPARAREKDAIDYGVGLITNVPFPENEVAQVVSDIAQNGIIRGTKEYNKDEYISGAEAAATSNLFPAWSDGGKVFYKIRKQALDPRNFKQSNDVGTVAVRYVVQPEGEKNSVLRIDAVFVEDFRHTVHPSDGSVESGEYKVIQEHLDAIDVMKKQAGEVEQERQQRLAKKKFGVSEGPQTASMASLATVEPDVSERQREALAAGPGAGETLEQHVANLRHELQLRVKAPGAPLKSAPFHSASTMTSLPSGAEVLVVITTPYWLGVETHDGQHGWIPREQLETLP